MKSFTQRNDPYFGLPGNQSSGKLSFLRFLFRYPVFLLAFGPPIFRDNAGIDVTKGKIDVWAFVQVAWVGLIAVRAVYSLSSSHTILIPKQVRSILRLFFILGLLFLASAEYSPSRLASAAYAIFYLLTLICVAEFVVDSYRNPPDWMQCLFHLRFMFLLLFLLVLCTIPFRPMMVMAVIPGVGIRLSGGAVASITVICPLTVIISAYTFLFSLESKARSIIFFMIGMAGTLLAQSRGCEIALLASLALVAFLWATSGKRSSYLFLAASFASVLLGGVVLAIIGGGRIWSLFNRGGDTADIESASGRTDIWKFVFQYCMAHPLGMGYVAGFRIIFRQYFALGLQFEVTRIGNAHNAFMDVLAGAGWPALAVYVVLLVKIVALGWRYARKRSIFSISSELPPRHALRCSLALLVYCLISGLTAADFVVPLKAPFYLQFVIIAMILGMSARMLAASRVRPAHLQE